jgi:SAM-dependent methyltransferase
VTPRHRAPDFARRARCYDALRPGIPGLDEALVQAGDLAGRKVLDVGCGTGRFAAVLATRFGSRVFGVDAEPEMLRVARDNAPKGVAFKLGRAEELPFKEGWFERATMVLVCHLVRRDEAFSELHRVLGPAGRVALATFDPGYFPSYYLNEFFPSVLEVDLARFPTGGELERELVRGGFREARVEPFEQSASIGRVDALARIRGRHISTFDLIDEDEYRRGLERAERELPDRISYRWEMLIVTAERA